MSTIVLLSFYHVVLRGDMLPCSATCGRVY